MAETGFLYGVKNPGILYRIQTTGPFVSYYTSAVSQRTLFSNYLKQKEIHLFRRKWRGKVLFGHRPSGLQLCSPAVRSASSAPASRWELLSVGHSCTSCKQGHRPPPFWPRLQGCLYGERLWETEIKLPLGADRGQAR